MQSLSVSVILPCLVLTFVKHLWCFRECLKKKYIYILLFVCCSFNSFFYDKHPSLCVFHDTRFNHHVCFSYFWWWIVKCFGPVQLRKTLTIRHYINLAAKKDSYYKMLYKSYLIIKLHIIITTADTFQAQTTSLTPSHLCHSWLCCSLKNWQIRVSFWSTCNRTGQASRASWPRCNQIWQ